jgi:hypothetical protein
MKGLQVVLDQGAVQLDFDVAAGTDRAVVGEADLLRKADA